MTTTNRIEFLPDREPDGSALQLEGHPAPRS
jgi:hypothetical protein